MLVTVETDRFIPSDQIFTVKHRPTGEWLHINVGLLQRIRKQAPYAFKLIDLDIDDSVYNFIITQRGVEEEHVARLSGAKLREPGLGFFDEQGNFTMIDGHHRAVRRYRGGVKHMKVWTTVPLIWRQALLDVEKGSELERHLTSDIAPDDLSLPPYLQGTARLSKA